ncbi:hypothetical protein G7046_g8898 [Stylonectria norvegica]|nr:hypothetical protein G7046_g8898 [Stylonectria norvegica]
MEFPFVTLDVFTNTPFQGNPLAVITIPHDSPKPTQAQKQAVAREFNLSESVFVHDVADHATNKQREIDIFLINAEVPFAGHPTIGTAVSLLPLGVDTLVTKAGPITLLETSPGVIQAGIPHNVHLHERRLGEQSSNPEISAVEKSARLFSIVKGMTFGLIGLKSLDLLAKTEIHALGLSAEEYLDEGWNVGFLSTYYYTLVGEREEAGKTVVSVRTRMIEAGFEDPATGSGACSLACFLTLGRGEPTPDQTIKYEITQGVEMGRESNMIIEVTVKDSKIDTVSLAGTATQVMRGYVKI